MEEIWPKTKKKKKLKYAFLCKKISKLTYFESVKRIGFVIYYFYDSANQIDKYNKSSALLIYYNFFFLVLNVYTTCVLFLAIK